MNLAFITEGGGQLGMGHVQQAITLASEVRDLAQVSFLTTSSAVVTNQITDAGFCVHARNSDDELLRLLPPLAPDLVIIDNLYVGVEFAKVIKEQLGIPLVIFTNLTAANRIADIAITADIGSNFRNLRLVDSGGKTIYFYGPKYWILRKEFYEFSGKHKPLPDTIRRILLIFGGSDPLNLTAAVLDELLKHDAGLSITVIVGASYMHLDALHRVIAAHEQLRKTIAIHQNTQLVAELMYKADLVVTSPGLSFFEALCVGTPVIGFHQDHLQGATYREDLPTFSKEEVAKLGPMIQAHRFISPYDDFVVNMEIGQGKGELIKEILGLAQAELPMGPAR